MSRFIYSPAWFFGKDIFIDVLSVIVLLLIAYFSYRFYSLSREKKYAFFSTSYLVIALSFIFKIITNFSAYYNTQQIREVKRFVVKTVSASGPTLFNVTYFFHRLLLLLGLYFLYKTLDREQATADNIFIIFFILLTTYFSTSAYFVFHLTSLMILMAVSWRYYVLYKARGNENTKRLYQSFSIIAVSSLVFIFVNLSKKLYVVAETIQLVGFLLLLYTFIKVMIHGKEEKKPNADN